MKYMFLLFDEKTADQLTEAESAAWFAFRDNSQKVAELIASFPLQPPANATTISVRNGKRMASDGPFVETKEVLGGFFIFDCENLDVALDIASKAPCALTGHVEVRPIFEVEAREVSRAGSVA
jgi:hypothetical protein